MAAAAAHGLGGLGEDFPRHGDPGDGPGSHFTRRSARDLRIFALRGYSFSQHHSLLYGTRLMRYPDFVPTTTVSLQLKPQPCSGS